MNKPLILIVEDDPPIRNLISVTLEAHEYRHIVAGNAGNAILEASSLSLGSLALLPQKSTQTLIDSSLNLSPI